MTDDSKQPQGAADPFNYWAFFGGMACSPVAVHFLGGIPRITGLVTLTSLLVMFGMQGAWVLCEKLGLLKPAESLTMEQRVRRGRPARAILVFVVGHGIGFALVHAALG